LREKRSYFDTILEILKAYDAGDETSHSLHRTDLDDEELARYLATLVGYGLLKTVDDGYRTTEKGRLFLERLEKLLGT